MPTCGPQGHASLTAAPLGSIAYYEAFHQGRLDHLFATCVRTCPDPATRVLDVGRTAFSTRLLGHYASVTTLGFPLDRADGPGGAGRKLQDHIVYELNAAQWGVPIAAAAPFGLIVFAEVLEHLYTSPELTLAALTAVLVPGGVMVLQTPNAAALYKRLMLLAGFQPYELIRTTPDNPGHFREYTKRELVAYARTAGLEVVEHAFTDGMRGEERFGGAAVLGILKGLAALVPSFARGQTLVLRRPKEG